MPKRSDQFQTIRTEGALLPPDILQSVASLKVDGVSPKSYHLPPGVKLNEAIAQSWSVLQKHWKGFQEARRLLDPDKPGTEITNQNWLLPLFEELKYGRLTTVKSPEIDGRIYAIERFYAGQPIHLIGCNLPLDRRTTGVRGAATASPHSMIQEYLNRSENGLWGFLSNGLVLRILRDNVSLSRQAYIEFNLESMMEGEVYADFALLWMLGHQSRVEAEKPQDCWLEKWSQLARDLGTRVLSDLRTGVAKSIEALGRGFLSHPRNDRLREKLHSGRLSTQDFYRQLLRVIYRLLFLFVAEDRELLHPPGADENACKLYDAYYSTRRLRELADRLRGSKHADLWQALSLVFDALGRPSGCPDLGLSPLGSFLWQRSSTPGLLAPAPKGSEPVAEPSLVANDDLLAAVRALAYVEQDKVRRSVDYRNLGSEELGSVYESLLELHPIVNAPARTFDLSVAAGNERKTTGSYYTPDSLVQCLLDSALDPVVDDRLQGKKGTEAESALLDIKVCDPACGSGHFLIAAAHRLARRLARIRTGESEPAPTDYQHALRDVIGRSIYGVDINPMAVELCKVSLWMEAIEPGRPLSFLDHHIQSGNSLLGTTPALLAKGIPDDAFNPIEGDDKAVAGDLKKQNKKERQDYQSGQRNLFEPFIKLGNLPSEFLRLSSAGDDSVTGVAEKERRYAELVSGADYQNARLLADTWCAAFVWKKDKSEIGKLCPTEREFRKIENDPHSILPQVRSEIRRLAEQNQFFHWHLAFPDIFRLPAEGEKPGNQQTGWDGGFDVVLGNPPWDEFRPEERFFFASRHSEIGLIENRAKRQKAIEALESVDPMLWEDWMSHRRAVLGGSHLLHSGGRLPLSTRGNLSTANLFVELKSQMVSTAGRAGTLVPSGLVTNIGTADLFSMLMSEKLLCSLYDFENRAPFFPNVDSRMRFVLVTIHKGPPEPSSTRFGFFLQSISDIVDSNRVFHLSAEDIERVNPSSKTCPVFRSPLSATLVTSIYRRHPTVASNNAAHEWRISTSSMFQMSHEADDLFTEPKTIRFPVPLYEGKMVAQYNHRAASIRTNRANVSRQAQSQLTSSGQLADAFFDVSPQYWVPSVAVNRKLEGKWSRHWLLHFCAVTSPTNERTCVSCVTPWAGAGHSLFQIFANVPTLEYACVLGNLNSLPLDFVLREKMGGINLSHFIFQQLPIVDLASYCGTPLWNESASARIWVAVRVIELTYTAWNLAAFARDCEYDGPPFCWDEERRFLLRCELDAAYFHLYLRTPAEWGADSSQLREMFPTPRHAVEYIMETFPIVKRKDIARTEIKNDSRQVVQEGRYITKNTILEIYDEMAEAIRTGQPYKTRLDPPPGPPTDEAGNFIPMAKWDKANWPSHIHPPREEAVAP